MAGNPGLAGVRGHTPRRLPSCFAVVTMAEVARLAGVSVTTVSHVINGTRPASKRTREKVMAAVDWFAKDENNIAVMGWGEGGMIALFAGDPILDWYLG